MAQPQALSVFCLDISDLVASLAGILGLSSSVLRSICFGAWLPVFVLGLLINNNGVSNPSSWFFELSKQMQSL